MTYVTSDLHGYPLDAFLRLLDSAGFTPDDTLYVLGDVTDRNGDGGVAALRWISEQPNVKMIRGNHEQMLLDCLFLFEKGPEIRADKLSVAEIMALYTWKVNGAEPTIDALLKLRSQDGAAFARLTEYVSGTPLYARRCVNGREYILTHSGLGGYAPEKNMEAYTADELLWTRPLPDDAYDPAATVIFGHTPTGYYGKEYAGKMLKTPTWIDIDTGAAAGGAPMLLRLEDEKPFYGEIPRGNTEQEARL